MARYRKLVRWYPANWQKRNGEAIVSVLMDEDDAHGRIAPTLSSSLTVVAAGLYERFIAPERLNRFGLGTQIAAATFSVWYLAVIAWAPGISYAGTVGPFSNPSAIVGVMLGIGLVCALLGRGRTARLIAMLSVPVTILIGILSASYSWLGPGLPAVVIFVGLGIAAGVPLRSASDVGRALGALFLVVLGILLSQIVFARLPVLTSSPAGLGTAAGAVASFAGALALLWPLRPRLRHKH
ncbi:hypothetical protein GCM10022381_09150 [Leifsonia kafniensis]|uniref:Rhomboid family intramembrane serine protease n=1 Tax=Leifsonia kafniensis TaxID=475957 RepID=A0ABP7K9P1_9MICO